MAGYTLQGKTSTGDMVDIPLAATYDDAGNEIQQYYAAKTEYEAIMAQLSIMDDKLDVLRGVSVPDFADASWSDINKYSQKGLAKSLWNIGDEKQITLSTGENITMVILGFDHDDLTAGGKAGITLGMKNCLAIAYPMNASATNTGGWAESAMRTTTMETLYGYLPDEVKAVIKPVDKITGRYDNSGALETTSDKLFLFSVEEVMGTNKYSVSGQRSFAGEGEQYEYFKAAPTPTPTSGTGAFSVLEGTGCFYTTSTSVASGYTNRFAQAKTTTTNYYYNYNNAKAQGDSATTSCYWWLRSPYCINSYGFCYVDSNGGSSNNNGNGSIGVAFGFCI